MTMSLGGLQVGYWKDLLEIVVRQCVSAEVMQQRTQQAMANRLAFAGKKREGNTKLSKQVCGSTYFTHEWFAGSRIWIASVTQARKNSLEGCN